MGTLKSCTEITVPTHLLKPRQRDLYSWVNVHGLVFIS